MFPHLRRPESRYCLPWEAIGCSPLLLVLSGSEDDVVQHFCIAPGGAEVG
jgi:hypothetical protein